MSSTNPYASNMPKAQSPLSLPAYGCSFTEAVKRFFRNYATFKGRASRSEYWWSRLFIALAGIVFSILTALLGTAGKGLSSIWTIAILIPQISVAVRRLHDSNKSGWWYFVPFVVEYAGGAIFIVGVVSAASGAILGAATQVMLGLVLLIAGIVLEVVLMVLRENPAGVRFDNTNAPDYPVATPYMAGQPGQTMPFQQQYDQQAPQAPFNQPGQPGQQGQNTSQFGQPTQQSMPEPTAFNQSAQQPVESQTAQQVPPTNQPVPGNHSTSNPNA